MKRLEPDILGARHAAARLIRDVGFLPEGEIHARGKASTPYQAGHDDKQYPMRRVMDTADLASGLEKSATAELEAALKQVSTGEIYLSRDVSARGSRLGENDQRADVERRAQVLL